MSDSFSYSKVDTYNKCPFKYKLVYVENHKIKSETIATYFGSLIHYIEEQIGLNLKEGKTIDYDYYKNIIFTVNIKEEKEEVLGINSIKEKYPSEWDVQDKQGFSYEDKTKAYIESGIYRLENYLKSNPNISIYAVELPFEFPINGTMFRGFIDRVFYDKGKDLYVVEDIKTYTKILTHKELKTALQMYVYTEALKIIVGSNDIKIECYYNLPLINQVQKSVLDNKIITEDLDITLKGIKDGVFHPNPSPLCHWCPFSKTFPNQPAEAKNLCPYFCHWTRENKRTVRAENEWQGESMHKVILENFVKKNS